MLRQRATYRRFAGDLSIHRSVTYAVALSNPSPIEWHRALVQVRHQRASTCRVGVRQLGAPGIVLISTRRTDGRPRISPVESLFWRGGSLTGGGVGLEEGRRPRSRPAPLVLSIAASRDASAGEYKLRGHAIAEEDDETQTGTRLPYTSTAAGNRSPVRPISFGSSMPSSPGTATAL